MKRTIILVFIFSFFSSCDRKLREAEKIYDKLEIDVSSGEIVRRLDFLEKSLPELPETYYINAHAGGIRFNDVQNFIKAEDINIEYLNESSITREVFTLEQKENIVMLFKILSRNQIRIQDFTSNYSCNGETLFFYKDVQCGPNNYCERRLYIRKGESLDVDCFNDSDDLLGNIDDMAPIDSVGNIYLLKPKRYFR